jgi:hypothetical protein
MNINAYFMKKISIQCKFVKHYNGMKHKKKLKLKLKFEI